MKVMNHDRFGGEEIEPSHDNYNIVYGSTGWTDAIDDATIEVLRTVGAIALHQTYQGVYNRVRIYVSLPGKDPK